MNDPVNCGRRRLLFGLAALPVMSFAATAPTPSASEGPFYPTGSMRFADTDNNLVKISGKVEQAGGEIIELAGRVLDRSGTPIEGARVEIWQCDVNGRYLHGADRGGRERDSGFQGFGHDITGNAGGYAFRTIKPVPYGGRTPHIHVKVLVANQERLTSQFYLAEHPQNSRDWLYRRIPEERLEHVSLRLQTTADLPLARLDIVV
jgi:protocatechuate 3,4-dioxygenase beta subunit